MKQFTQDQVQRLRQKLSQDDGILAILDAAIAPVRQHYRIQTTAKATWGGFYACPKHSVNLTFNIADPHHYRCPVDGELLTGQPYEGAWWRLLNAANERACHTAALRYLLLGEAVDLDLARRILVDYATYYPGYEVHGGIPYNQPGKANAQTLCDASWLKGLAAAYDIIRDQLTPEEQALIEQDLLRCGADFVMAHRSPQLHNHECIANSAVGIIGILLDDDHYLDFALNTKYGFKYQLDHGVLKDGFWFEGTPGYHFYAMQQFIEFERFAGDAPYSFFRDPRFAEILKFPMLIVEPEGGLTPLNDAGNNARTVAGAEYLYELAFARTGDLDFARLLNLAYRDKPRQNIYAFFDGVESLPSAALPAARDYHGGRPGDSGLTTFNGPDGRFLLVKHSPYGGEHDHYDRLGLHFMAMGIPIVPDIGTTQYGAPLHYAYYKTTQSHNTVCLNGESQPPANCTVAQYQTQDGVITLDARVAWDGSYQPLDSFVIPQWSEEAYQGAKFRRHITWYGDFFIDCFDVSLPETRDIDWICHVRGQLQAWGDCVPHKDQWRDQGPGQYLKQVRRRQAQPGLQHSSWTLATGIQLDVYTLAPQAQLCYADGPDNPSVSDLSYLLVHSHADQARFINVFCASRAGSPVLSAVAEGEGGLVIRRVDGGCVRYIAPSFGGI